MRVVRYSEEPALWDSLDDLSSRVWPEYNLHGDVLNPYWNRLYDERADWQFVLCGEAEQVPLAEGRLPRLWHIAGVTRPGPTPVMCHSRGQSPGDVP